jgi:AraC-like DNA-binding protein
MRDSTTGSCILKYVVCTFEVALLGTDNDALICEMAFPAISSVDPNVPRMGWQVAHWLGLLIQGKEPQHRDANQTASLRDRLQARHIAELVSIDYPERLSHLFKRETGMTSSIYRKGKAEQSAPLLK